MNVMERAIAAATNATPTADRLRIDFLYLDLATCNRCRGTDENLASALDGVREVLEATGVEVEVNKVHVRSVAQARDLRFVTSPTIRIDGSDIALELRESPCEECTCEACTDGLGEQIACRLWVYRGREYTEAPAGMITDAILRKIYGGMTAGSESEVEPYELPANLERFFAGKARAGGSCCGGDETAECCGTSTAEGCGCR
jgi:hypothetical protein